MKSDLPFDDMEDDVPCSAPALPTPVPHGRARIPLRACPRCAGTGLWAWKSLEFGDVCLRCHGSGFVPGTIGDPSKLARARQRYIAHKSKARVSKAKAWARQNAARAEWLARSGSPFALRMLEIIDSTGTLSDGESAAIDRAAALDQPITANQPKDQPQ